MRDGFIEILWEGKPVVDPVRDVNGQPDADATFEYILELEKLLEE